MENSCERLSCKRHLAWQLIASSLANGFAKVVENCANALIKDAHVAARPARSAFSPCTFIPSCPCSGNAFSQLHGAGQVHETGALCHPQEGLFCLQNYHTDMYACSGKVTVRAAWALEYGDVTVTDDCHYFVGEL